MPEFRWSEGQQRWRDAATGRMVAQAAVNQAVDSVIVKVGERLASITEQLQSNEITLAEWQTQMAHELKMLHIGAAMVGRGGRAQMSQGDWGWTGQRLRTQYAFLRQFAQDIATGKQKMDGRLLARAQMYAQAARATQREMMRRTAGIIGRVQERNVLGSAEHCAGCVRATSMGWVPIGTLPAIGTRECRSNCRCTIQTRGHEAMMAA